MLPVYVAFLQEMQRSVASGNVLKKEDVARYRKELRSLYVRTLQPLVNPATALLSSVEPRQIEELVQSLAKENKKQKDKELSGSLDDKRHIRAERTVDFLENIVGAFSDSQLEQIRAASIKLPFATSIYMQMREDNQAHLLGLLANNSKEEVVANFLSLWLLMPEKFRSPEEQRILQEFERASDEMIAEVYSILNEHQRDKLLKTIEKYIASFQDLSSQSQLSNTNSRLKNVSIFDI